MHLRTFDEYQFLNSIKTEPNLDFSSILHFSCNLSPFSIWGNLIRKENMIFLVWRNSITSVKINPYCYRKKTFKDFPKISKKFYKIGSSFVRGRGGDICQFKLSTLSSHAFLCGKQNLLEPKWFIFVPTLGDTTHKK